MTEEAKGNQVLHSATSLKQFSFCERAFYFQRILGLPEKPGPALAVGIAYHAALERLVRDPDAQLKEIVPAALLAVKSEKSWCDPGLPEGDLLAEISANLVRLRPIVKALPPLVRDGVPLVEAWCEKRTGKVDLVSSRTPTCEDGQIISTEEGPCILDWKTTAKPKGGGKWKKDHSLQLALYALEFGCTSGCTVEIPRDHRLEIYVDVVRFDQYELARWEKYFVAQFGAMASRGSSEAEYKLAERGHPLCCPAYCSFWDRCPGGAGL